MFPFLTPTPDVALTDTTFGIRGLTSWSLSNKALTWTFNALNLYVIQASNFHVHDFFLQECVTMFAG